MSDMTPKTKLAARPMKPRRMFVSTFDSSGHYLSMWSQKTKAMPSEFHDQLNPAFQPYPVLVIPLDAESVAAMRETVAKAVFSTAPLFFPGAPFEDVVRTVFLNKADAVLAALGIKTGKTKPRT